MLLAHRLLHHRQSVGVLHKLVVGALQKRRNAMAHARPVHLALALVAPAAIGPI